MPTRRRKTHLSGNGVNILAMQGSGNQGSDRFQTDYCVKVFGACPYTLGISNRVIRQANAASGRADPKSTIPTVSLDPKQLSNPLARLKLGNQRLQAGLGVAEIHAGVLLEEERVLDSGKTGAHRALEDEDGAR